METIRKEKKFVELVRSSNKTWNSSMTDVGTPLGQRVLMPYQVSTDTFVEGDDLHFVNNMQCVVLR